MAEKQTGTGKKTARGSRVGAPPVKPAKQTGRPAALRGRNRLPLVRSLIEKWAGKMETEGASKTGVAELVRLLVLEKELTASNQEQVREIRVTWVEPRTTES
jgi:hypothetical protein